MAGLRILEIVFCVYFLTHIPITVLIDSQIVFPDWIYPTFVSIRRFIDSAKIYAAVLNAGILWDNSIVGLGVKVKCVASAAINTATKSTNNVIVWYYILSIHLYSASCSARQSEALPVRETQREESNNKRIICDCGGNVALLTTLTLNNHHDR